MTGPLSAPELLSATGLHHAYRRLAAVDDVDLQLAPGARHALVGPNGAGKTTLLHLLAGTLRPSGGRIVFAGRDITHLKPAQRARLGIARTFQHPAILDSLSTLDNVVVAAWRHTGGRAPWGPVRYRALVGHCRHQLAQLGLADVAAQAAGTLSHGTRRLLELAMALAARPRLLLLDEPAAGLEDADLHRLRAVLRGLPPDTAVVLVEHNLDLVAAVADTVTVLHDGRVLAAGSHDDIAADPTVREVYLGTPVEAAG